MRPDKGLFICHVSLPSGQCLFSYFTGIPYENSLSAFRAVSLSFTAWVFVSACQQRGYLMSTAESLKILAQRIGPEATDLELCNIKQSMLALLDSLDSDLKEESDDSILPDGTELRDRLYRSNMSRETVNVILSSWESVMRNSADGIEEGICTKRWQLMSRLLSFKAPAFTKKDLKKAGTMMNLTHEGLGKLKKFLLDEMAGSIMCKKSPRPVLLVGPPGCGKTSLAVSLASAFPEKGHAVISLAGKDAAFELMGADQGWRAATFGLILQGFARAGSLSPVIIFDELDKTGTSDSHGRVESAFLDLLQPERARLFTDSYMALPVDVSKAWFIFTANTLQGIPEPVLDRLSVFEMDSYSFDDMKRIAERLVQKLNASSSCHLNFSPEAIGRIVLSRYASGWSVRPLEEAIERVFADKAAGILAKRDCKRLEVQEDDVIRVIEKEGMLNLISNFSYSPGTVTCIALVGDGGCLFPVEAHSFQRGNAEVKVTGLVENVMLESANIAYDLASLWLERNKRIVLSSVTVNYTYSFHKRGDSASLATALAIVSDATGCSVRKTLAVTGAVSLTGNVLPVGGVIMKIIAASRQGADEIMLPEACRIEVESVPEGLLPRVRLSYVRSFDEAVFIALGLVRSREKRNIS